MNIEEVINNLKKYISFSEKECNFPSIFDWNWHMELANDIETLLTAYEKEKEKNKELNKLKGFEMLDIFNMGKQSSRQRIEFDYVDKEKIKAGIEEARKRYNDLHTKHLRDCGIAEQRELAKIEFGESLLKEE